MEECHSKSSNDTTWKSHEVHLNLSQALKYANKANAEKNIHVGHVTKYPDFWVLWSVKTEMCLYICSVWQKPSLILFLESRGSAPTEMVLIRLCWWPSWSEPSLAAGYKIYMYRHCLQKGKEYYALKYSLYSQNILAGSLLQ